MVAFGKAPIFQTNVQFDFGVSDDKRAFTLSFNNLEVSAQPGAPPITTRAWSVVLPLEKDGEWGEIALRLSGFVLTHEGTTTTIVFSVNGQTKVSDFAANEDQSFIQEMQLTTETQSECIISVFLLLSQEPKNQDASGFLSVASIDGENVSRRSTGT